MIKLPPRPERKVKESGILGECLRAIGAIRGVRCARNNVGVLTDVRGIPVAFGLGVGSPDIVGIITIGGPESAINAYAWMPPKAFAFGLECKVQGKYATPAQRSWHEVAKRRGMHVDVVRAGVEAARKVTDELERLEHWLDAVARRGA